jgi:hypothetical protein
VSALEALNRVCKWRVLLTGWQLGTRAKGDPEGDAVRDHREVTILLRVETSALIGLLLRKGVITQEEWESSLAMEADMLSDAFAAKFPGVTARPDGLSMDMERITAAGWMRKWLP